uniref:J domain-containing protein n=1 Tax=Panagrolaimus sp. ES5 TaxID=591445 RepID=A0AC34G897_9BILA
MGNSNSSRKNYFAVLGVSPYASDKEIKKAFHKLSLKYHPDRNMTPEAISKMKEINEAYHVLYKSKNEQRYEAVDPRVVEENLRMSEEINKSKFHVVTPSLFQLQIF